MLCDLEHVHPDASGRDVGERCDLLEGFTCAADGSGNWTYTPSTPIANGTVVNVVAQDAAGNSSPGASVTVDSQAPAAPVLNPSNGTTLSGTAEPGATVTLTDGNGSCGGLWTTDTGSPIVIRGKDKLAEHAVWSLKCFPDWEWYNINIFGTDDPNHFWVECDGHGKILFPGYPEGYYENHFRGGFQPCTSRAICTAAWLVSQWLSTAAAKSSSTPWRICGSAPSRAWGDTSILRCEPRVSTLML